MKPQYIIWMGRDYPGYYHEKSHWKPVEKDKAQKLSHKEANKISNYLKRLGYKGASMERC